MKDITEIIPSENKDEINPIPGDGKKNWPLGPNVDENWNYTILHKMFDWQKRFGDHCFQKNGITDNQGNILTFDKIYHELQEGKFGPNDLPNVWLKKFHECMVKELEELDELLPWKHWSKATIGEEVYPDKSQSERLNELKIELVDIWHFLMSSFMCVGMGPKELYDLYIAKNKVNFERQQKGYNTAHKTNDDNSKLAKEFASK
jgi:hypothetical protein